MSRSTQLYIMFMISVPFSIINFSAYSKGYMPSELQATASMLFIAIWFVLGLMSSSKWKEFMLLSTCFWIGGGVLLAVGYFVDFSAIFISVALIIPGPAYGIRYFWHVPSDMIFAIVSAVVCYIWSILGLGVGKIVRTQKLNITN